MALKMKCAQVVITVSLVLISVCVSSSEACNVLNDVANCEEDFKFPLDVDTKIRQLFVRNLNVKNLTKNDFAGYTNLEVIDFSNSGLQFIEVDTFESLTNLKELNIAANKELKIPEDGHFIRSSSLIKLNLSDIIMENIHNDIFEGLPNLEELDLSYTDLKSLPSEPFSRTPKLKILTLSKDNRIDINKLCRETNVSEIIQRITDEGNEVTECKVTSDGNVQNAANTTKIDAVQKTESSGDENVQTVDENEQEVQVKVTQIDETNVEESATEDATESAVVQNGELKIGTTMQDMEETTTITLGKEDDETELGNVQPNEANVYKMSTPEETKTSLENKTHSDVLDSIFPSPPHVENILNKEAVMNAGEKRSKEDILLDVNSNTDEEQAKPSMEGTSTASSGTNIVLGIIVCVMVVGAAGFGYKYWKNHRGYRNTATEDNVEEGKELQTIVSNQTDTEQH